MKDKDKLMQVFSHQIDERIPVINSFLVSPMPSNLVKKDKFQNESSHSEPLNQGFKYCNTLRTVGVKVTSSLGISLAVAGVPSSSPDIGG